MNRGAIATALAAMAAILAGCVAPKPAPQPVHVQVASAAPTTAPVAPVSVPISPPAAGPLGKIAFYGDGTFVGYIGVGMDSALLSAGFGAVSSKGCGGMELAQFVGRVPTDPANACEAPNTLAAHSGDIAGASTVVVAFVANDWSYTPAQTQADAQSAVDQIETIDPNVQRVIYIKNFIGNGTHDADLAAVAAAQPALVSLIDLRSAYGGDYALCADPNKQSHPTDACSANLVAEISRQVSLMPWTTG
jgi:hypothetical protein